jgi:hypothetical protein
MGEFLKNPLAEVRGDEGMWWPYKNTRTHTHTHTHTHKKGYLNTVGRLLLSIKWDGPHETPLER